MFFQKRKKYIAAICLCSLLASCSGQPEQNTDNKNTDNIPSSILSAEPLSAQVVTGGIYAFSDTIFQRVVANSKDQNVVFSPFSVYSILAMIANGAGEDTRASLEAALGVSDLSALDQNLRQYRTHCAEKGIAEIQNGIWTNTLRYTLNDSYREIVEYAFGGKAEGLDFSKASSLRSINGWVKDATHDLIPKVLDELKESWAAVLANTIYFNGKWVNPYTSNDIWYDMPFTQADGTIGKVDALCAREYTYFTTENAAGFSKAYENGCRFVAILPEEGIDIYEYVTQLSLSSLAQTAAQAVETSACADVYLPKFSYDTDIPLTDILKNSDFALIFEQGTLTAMGNTNDGSSVYISEIFQKAKIRLDEDGTEAAAVTVAIAECTSAMPETPIPTLYLNRPFVYAIYDDEKLPLFAGIYAYNN